MRSTATSGPVMGKHRRKRDDPDGLEVILDDPATVDVLQELEEETDGD